MPVLTLADTDPFTNLAIEELLLESAAGRPPTLLLYRNASSVVIGRHQNPWIECNLPLMRRDRVELVRRVSGGGTVYHDEGNTNFSFIAPAGLYDQRRQFGVIVSGLAAVGVSAWVNPRNDVMVGERKISGNAFRHSRGCSLHHGTLLVNADLTRLGSYLSPVAAGIETRAIESVRSAVMNLREAAPDLSHHVVCDALASAFVAEYGEEDAPSLSGGPASGQPGPGFPDAWTIPVAAVVARARQRRAWEWRYGMTPPFTRTLTQLPGVRALTLRVRRGAIVEVEGGDPGLRRSLLGLRYRAREIAAAADTADHAHRETLCGIAEEID